MSAETFLLKLDPDRPVGAEVRKTYALKIRNGFWQRFIRGPAVLDIGFRGNVKGTVPIIEGAIGVDLDYPHYDGRILPFEAGSQDAVFSSHCLEHIHEVAISLQEWHRVVRIGGHIITIVPSAMLYERRRRPPSRWNPSHTRVYNPASLLTEFEAALAPNTYRVRHLVENDLGYRYEDPAELHPFGCYEIELVVEKISPPAWRLED
jgi:SAM-dependent methyltransferase